MDERYLTLAQALQLVGIGPSLFLAAFLALTAKHLMQVVVPILFFLVLACSFAQPLLPVILQDPQMAIMIVIALGESMIPALSFLLILQIILGRIPPLPYWLILAIPVVGGSAMIYASQIQIDEVCIVTNLCASALTFKTLYHVFATSLIFLLLIVLFMRKTLGMQAIQLHKKHQYWLIISLVFLSLILLVLDLAELSNHIPHNEHSLISTVVRISYIYLVMTSIFRVFDRQFEIDEARIPSAKAYVITHQDEALSVRIRTLMEQEKLYREMAFSREKLATILAVSEHQLSKVINRIFGKNFNRLVNGYRTQEAKERLVRETVSITVIAFEVGFNSIASFNRVFKEEVGLSPTEYREAATKNSAITT